jgi:hypothetical protein
MASRTISVEILGDSRDLERAFDRSSKAAKDFNRQVTGGTVRAELGFGNLRKQALGLAGGYLAIGTAATALGEGLAFSIETASNLNEQISKSEVVFGSASGEIEDWSKTTARSIGIAQDEALEAAGTFGNLFRTVGLGGAPAAEMSRTLVQLAADLAAFSNTDPADALLALRSGLIGEAEPLRRYGVLLSETRVQQAAMAETGKTNAKSLTDQEKALARYRIILSDTKTAQGNFADTSAGFAQQTKILQAAFRDLSAQIGNVAIPVLTDLVTMLNDGFVVSGQLAAALGDIRESLPLPDIVDEHVTGVLKEVALQLSPAGWVRRAQLGLGLVADQFRNVASAAEEGLAAMDKVEGHRLEFAPVEGAGGDGGGVALTPRQRREFFDARIGRERERVQDLPNLRAQVARLKEIAAQIQARMEATKDITRRLALEDELLRVQREIRSTQAQMASEAERAERDALDHQKEMTRLAKERAEAARERAATAQFAALGLGPGGADPVPGIRDLQKRLTRMFKEPGLDAKARNLMKRIKGILGGGMGEVSEEVRAKIEEMLAGIDQSLAEHQRRRVRSRPVNPDALLAGLGLTTEQIRTLRGRIGSVSRGGKVPLGGQSAFGVRLPGAGGVVVNGPVTVRTDNPDKLASELQKRARRQAVQTRGQRPGSRQSVDG